MSKFNIGDTVRTNDGTVTTVTGATFLYNTKEGNLYNESQLILVERYGSDEAIVKRLCKSIDANFDLLQSPLRKRNVVNQRHCIMYILRHDYNWSYEKIGKMFNRAHCTVINAVFEVSGFISINDLTTNELITKLREIN